MLTIQDLIDNGTVATDGGSLLAEIGAGIQPFIVFSLPRNAGKSTVTEAVLATAPAGTPRHDFLGTEAERDALLARAPEGYLVVAEMGHRGRPGYLAGEEITRAFELVEHGYPLATSLHADTVEQLVAVLAEHGVTPEQLGAVRYLIKVQPLGDPFAPDTRRVVEAIHETAGVDATGSLVTHRRYGDG
jgi:hypothetical protein